MGGGGAGERGGAAIPGGVRRTIQNIKEIAGNQVSDEEVYAMLRDCAMDADETVHRLLQQDTFHEVRRKRDKKKENTRESSDSRWRPAGREGRGGRGSFSSRYVSNDAGGGRISSAEKENGVYQGSEKGISAASSSITQETENKSTIMVPSSVSGLANGPSKVEHLISTQGCASHVSGLGGISSVKESSAIETPKIGTALPVANDKSGPASERSAPSSDEFQSYMTAASLSGVYTPASDPVLVPSFESHVPGTEGTIKHEVRSQRAVLETTINRAVSRDLATSESLAGKVSSEMNSSFTYGKFQGKSQGFEGNQPLDASQVVSSSSLAGSGGSRPSSNYSSRSQQLSGSQKVGPTKEWKPKSTQANPVQPSGIAGTPGNSEVVAVTREVAEQLLPEPVSAASEDTALKLQKKLEELLVSDTKHVIIPNHLQVPESERTGLSFGSFDASFGLGTRFADGPDNDKDFIPLSESSQHIEENDEEFSSSVHVASPTKQEPDHLDHSRPQTPENLSSREGDVVPPDTSAVPEYDQSKLEATLAPGHQYSVVQTAPSYSTFGLVPQIFGSQFTSFETTDPQPRDASRLPSFVVPQPFDPSTSFYAQIYRPTADGDGRFSPFITSAPATKLNGNVAVLPPHTGQSPQESGSSLVLSSAGATPFATQASGLMQSSIAVNQQAVPVFRPPAGVHMPHYPPNYLAFSQYISPFFVPPPTIHPFLNNTPFPQQPPTGSIYPAPAAAGAANPVKHSISQYKPGTNTGSPIGIPAGYGTYSSGPPGYSPNPAASSGNSTSNDDTITSQYKENNVYITGQQSEGSALWMPGAGRDISGLQGSSFYSIPGQGQHMSFAPTQAGHGAFAGIYHPIQTVAAANVHPLLQQSQAMAGAIEMVGTPAGVYQQPRAQVNWTNNY